MTSFIPIGYTEEELAYAGKFKEVVTELDKEGLKDMIAHVVEKDKRKEVLDMPLLDFKLDRSESYGGGGSTDIGDMSLGGSDGADKCFVLLCGRNSTSFLAGCCSGKRQVLPIRHADGGKSHGMHRRRIFWKIRSSSKRLIRTGWKSWTERRIRIRFRRMQNRNSGKNIVIF